LGANDQAEIVGRSPVKLIGAAVKRPHRAENWSFETGRRRFTRYETVKFGIGERDQRFEGVKLVGRHTRKARPRESADQKIGFLETAPSRSVEQTPTSHRERFVRHRAASPRWRPALINRLAERQTSPLRADAESARERFHTFSAPDRNRTAGNAGFFSPPDKRNVAAIVKT
jgi:hypothetical protein